MKLPNKLSAPIFRLKRQAKALSVEEKIPLHEALDRIATQEGYKTWSLLASRLASSQPGKTLIGELAPGDMVLLSARPGQGKTLLGLELAIEAVKAGGQSAFFSLEYNEADITQRVREMGETPQTLEHGFRFDNSDDICASYIIQKLEAAPQGTMVVIDYLQLLDQKRNHPGVEEQVKALKVFARERGLTIVFISQIHRSYDAEAKPFPELADVRLPNPLDLALFNKTCFLNDGEVNFAVAA